MAAVNFCSLHYFHKLLKLIHVKKSVRPSDIQVSHGSDY